MAAILSQPQCVNAVKPVIASDASAFYVRDNVAFTGIVST